MVVAMDQAVGTIVSAFQEKGIWNNTLLIFSTGVYRMVNIAYYFCDTNQFYNILLKLCTYIFIFESSVVTWNNVKLI